MIYQLTSACDYFVTAEVAAAGFRPFNAKVLFGTYVLIHWQLASIYYLNYSDSDRGTRWRSWLRHCATSRKVAGSIPDGVIGIFL